MPPNPDLVALQRSVEHIAEDDHLVSADAGLLLWWFRYGLAIDEFDAFEHLLETDAHRGIDGWFIAESLSRKEPDSLLLFEVKANFDAAVHIDIRTVDKLAQNVREIGRDPAGWLQASAEWRTIGRRTSLERRLKQRGDLKARAVLITTGQVSKAAADRAAEHDIEVHDGAELAALAQALDRSTMLVGKVLVTVPEDRRFVSKVGSGRRTGQIAVCEVQARDIAKWPGIHDRSLFGLNVRHELTSGRVRDELDRALGRRSDHPYFLAYHNGLTVVCKHITPTATGLEIQDLSVVNGAQSVIALERNSQDLSDDLRLLVKFVEVGSIPDMPLEVARRSNTQNAVNPRNLRALDAQQQRLEEEFAKRYPSFTYVTRPDAPAPPGKTTIANDEAAQWLCTLFVARPWLAVKRTELFRMPAYRIVFGPSVTAEHVVLAWHLRQVVQRQRDAVPKLYRPSWRFVALIHLFLVGQLLRDGEATSEWLHEPGDALANGGPPEADVAPIAAFVSAQLQSYHRRQLRDYAFDDFKVNFKREQELQTLARDVRSAWRAKRGGR